MSPDATREAVVLLARHRPERREVGVADLRRALRALQREVGRARSAAQQ